MDLLDDKVSRFYTVVSLIDAELLFGVEQLFDALCRALDLVVVDASLVELVQLSTHLCQVSRQLQVIGLDLSEGPLIEFKLIEELINDCLDVCRLELSNPAANSIYIALDLVGLDQQLRVICRDAPGLRQVQGWLGSQENFLLEDLE